MTMKMRADPGTIGSALPAGKAWSAQRWLAPLVNLRAAPHDVAFGAAIGVFIAFTPTIGLQTVLAALLATMLGTSRPAAILPVWISNPLTMGPMFAFTYWIGTLVTPRGGLFGPADAQAGTLDTFVATGADVLVPLTVGGCLIGLIGAGLTYIVLKRVAEAVQARRAIGKKEIR